MPDNIPAAEPAPTQETHALPTPYDGNTATPETFGSGIGGNLQQVGVLADHIAVVARDKANAAAVLAARGAADEAINKQILSDTEGFRALHGHDAMGGADKSIQQFNKSLGEIGSSLTNETQQAAFAHYALAKKEEAFRHVQNHLAQESGRVEAKSYDLAQKALLGGLSSLPVAMSAEDRNQKIAAATLTARARAFQIFGKSATAAELEDFTIPAKANAIKQVLETLIANEGTAGAMAEAKKIIADPATAGLLGGSHVAILEGRINRRADAQEGLGWARAAAKDSLIPGTTIIGEDASDKLSKVEGRPEMLKIAETELHRLKVAGQQMQTQRNEAAYTQGVTAIRKGDDASYQAALDVLSVDGGHGGEKQRALIEFRATQARRNAHDPTVIREQLANLNDAEQAVAHISDPSMSLDTFLSRPMADGRPLAQGLSLQGTAKIGEAFNRRLRAMEADKPLSAEAVKQIGATLVDALGFPTGAAIALTDEQIAQRNHVKDYVREQRNAWRAENPNKEPNSEQIQEWINEQIGKVPGSAAHWWNSDKTRLDIEIEKAKDQRANGAPVVFPRAGPPPAPNATAAAQPSAAPAAAPRPTRTVNGVTKTWNGTAWE